LNYRFGTVSGAICRGRRQFVDPNLQNRHRMGWHKPIPRHDHTIAQKNAGLGARHKEIECRIQKEKINVVVR